MPIVWNPTGRNVYWFEPHQDDACLFMAAAIAHHVLAERTVHVVLMSNGSTSSALGEINGDAVDGGFWHVPAHDPAREGYAPLTKTEFGLVRTAEWRQSWLHLGVPPERQHFGMGLASSDLLPDAITQAYATEVMQYWLDHDAAAGLPAPSLKTMWWGDTTQDHKNCGKALRALKLADPSGIDAQWMVRAEQRPGGPNPAPGSQVYTVPAAYQAEAAVMQLRSAHPYMAWLPAKGAYAAGRHSVPQLLEEGPLANQSNYIVRNP